MNKRVFLRKGESLLPQNCLLEDVFLKGRKLNSTPVDYAEYIGCSAFGSFLEDESLKDVGADRMVRKTTEKQSRWLIAAGVRTWKLCFANAPGGKDTGLYLGLGTVDCDDTPDPVCSADGHSCSQYLSEVMLNQSKPLLGLIMLNSTAASHIAQLTGITGANSCFATHVDAGACALTEAFYQTKEGVVNQALCGAGSQKITPWFLLAYEELLSEQDNTWLSEAASFVVLSDSADGADAELSHVYRGRLVPGKKELSSVLQDAFSKMEGKPQQILCVGSGRYKEKMYESLDQLDLKVPLAFIEDRVGYAGASDVFLGLNLSMLLQENNASLNGFVKEKSASSDNPETLLLSCGPDNQVSYFVIGGIHG